MHGPSLAATLAAALWLGLGPTPDDARPRPAEAIAQARALLAKDNPKAAVALLQEALPDAGADLGPMIVVLRQAYARAADQAAKAGRADEAEEFREDLQILNRKMRGQAPEEVRPTPTAPLPSPATRANRVPEEPGPLPFPIPRSGDREDGGPSAPTGAPAAHPEPPLPTPLPAVPRFDEPSRPEPVGGLDLPQPSPGSTSPIDPLAIDAPASKAEAPARPQARTASLANEPAPAPRDPALSQAVSKPEPPPTSGAGVSAADVGGMGSSTEPPPSRGAPPTRLEPAAPGRGLAIPEKTESPAPRPRDEPSTQPVPSRADGFPEVPKPRAAGSTASEVLKAADSAYLKGLYLEANVHYTRLAKAGQLPEGRKLHWAYCRSVEIVRRLKAKPSTGEEWAEINREIAEIKALSPKYWYAEYLRNRASEMSRTAAKAPKGRIVRGAMPEPEDLRDDSPARIRDLTRPVPAVPEQPPVGRLGKPGAFAMAIPSTDTPAVVTSQGDSSRWKIKESANFVIFHDDPALADRVAESAEKAREAVTRKWTGSPPPRPWAPKCEVYLYPTAAIFGQVTGQPPESPGFSTMESNGASITGRRIKLRGDAERLVEAVVPHEVTHVLLADLFPAKQIPRWADEGISVLSEPPTDQDRRVADLDAALDGGRIFTAEALMVSDYPEGRFWPLYYAQSVSLARFLAEQGKPSQLIDFLQGAQRNGAEPELKRVYGFENYADLQARWLEYAKRSSTARIAARNEASRTR